MKIIAGLGNPGAQYANTPHSVGFEAVDALGAMTGERPSPVQVAQVNRWTGSEPSSV